MQNYCISVDWLQVYCHGNKIENQSFESRGYKMEVFSGSLETKLFKHVVSVYVNKLKVATITQCPRNVVINPKTTLIKLENRVLYSSRYIDILYAIIEGLSLHYKGVTRIDLCYDCINLKDGRDPQRFLRHFLLKKEYTEGHVIKNGNRKAEAYFTRKSGEAMVINGMRFGSRNTAVGAYVYNKTLELLEVKDKPWIREFWRMNGLISDVDFEHLNVLTEKERARKIDNDSLAEYCRKSVWRFELSIKAEGTKVVDLSSGELFRISPSYIEHQFDLHQLFYDYAAKYFDFRQYDGLKRIKDYKKLEIFEKAGGRLIKPLSISKFHDCGRTEKMAYNCLDKLQKKYDDLSSSMIFGIEDAKRFLLHLSADKYKEYKRELQTQGLPLWNSGRNVIDDIKSVLGASMFSVLEWEELQLRARQMGLIKNVPDDIYTAGLIHESSEDLDPTYLMAISPIYP